MFLVKKYLDKLDNPYFVYPTKKRTDTYMSLSFLYFKRFN